MKPNVVAITVDTNQFPPAAFLAHKLSTLNPRDDVEIVVFSDSLKDLMIARQIGVPAELQHVSFSSPLPSPDKRLTGASFIRLFVPELLGQEVERIIYLDADVFPENEGLFGLFDLDMADSPLAATREVLTSEFELARVGVTARNHMNSGVLVIQRQPYLDADIRGRAVELSVKFGFTDQGALSRLLVGEWIDLSPAMNMVAPFVNSFVADVVAPAVLHFVGPIKHWHGPRFGLKHPARAEIEDYLLRTPWAGYLSSQVPLYGARLEPYRFDMPSHADLAEVAAYLRDTEFADVVQGLTKLDRSAIP